MRKMIIVPEGWPCKFSECPPGHFVYHGALCFKSEYGQDAYCDSGEYFCGGNEAKDKDLADIEVQPVSAEWVEEE